MGFLLLRSSVTEVDTGATPSPIGFTPSHYLMYDGGSGGGTAPGIPTWNPPIAPAGTASPEPFRICPATTDTT